MDRAWVPADETSRPETEQWIDEGSVRRAARSATARAGSERGGDASTRRRTRRIEESITVALERAVGARRAPRLERLLAEAASAMEHDRLDDARRAIAPVVKEAGDVPVVRELAGQIQYLLGQWKRAVNELEAFRLLAPDDVTNHPVLADCYRALGRHGVVEELWNELKAVSPSPDVMTEGRLVMAGSLADRGEITEAIQLLRTASRRPNRVRDHHLRQWYALGDLYDRAGNPIEAGRWFREVARVDGAFVDVAERLAALGR